MTHAVRSDQSSMTSYLLFVRGRAPRQGTLPPHGVTHPTTWGSTSTLAHQVLCGGTRTPPPNSRACCHATLDAMHMSHWLHRSTASPLIGNAAHRATGSLEVPVPHRGTEPPLRVTNAHAGTKPYRFLLPLRNGQLAAAHRSPCVLWTEPTLDPLRAPLASDSTGPPSSFPLDAKPRQVGPPYHLPGTLSDPITPITSGPPSALGAYGDYE